jgi:hypothetical protein
VEFPHTAVGLPCTAPMTRLAPPPHLPYHPPESSAWRSSSSGGCAPYVCIAAWAGWEIISVGVHHLVGAVWVSR